MNRTAGIIIIGDEILSAKFEDTNSPFMAKELRRRGIDLRRVVIIPDSIDEISREVRLFSGLFDYVFTTGGIGPTHDDMTIAGVAAAFGVKVVTHQELRDALAGRFPGQLTAERLRMAEVPEGSGLFRDGVSLLPTIVFRNVHIFPGIPELLRKKFPVLLQSFPGSPPKLTKVYVNEFESEIAPVLNTIVDQYSKVKIGSYPFFEQKDFRVIVTFESDDEDDLGRCVGSFVSVLPFDKVFRIE